MKSSTFAEVEIRLLQKSWGEGRSTELFWARWLYAKFLKSVAQTALIVINLINLT
jgi:hypothetical protein